MVFADLAAAFAAIALGLHLTTAAIAVFRCGRIRRSAGPAYPPISLIRPVCGLEPFLFETLRSSFEVDYPDYEIIFCFARPDDAAVATVSDLIKAHPERPSRLLIGDDRFSANPKLNNIAKAWNTANHRWIVVADSNALLARDTLRLLAGRWESTTGAVCSMPIGARPLNFWAEVECAFLNPLQARFQYVSEALGFGFAQGKAMLLRRDIIERAGGIRALAIDLAEDAAATKLVRAAGLKVHLVDVAVEQPLGRRSAVQVWARQLRWARLRRCSFPWLFFPEALLGIALPAVAVVLAASHYGVSVTGWIALLLSLWVGAEAALCVALGWYFRPRMILAGLVRDLLLPVLWLGAFLGSNFVWHGTPMRVRATRQPHRSDGWRALYRARLRVLREVGRRA